MTDPARTGHFNPMQAAQRDPQLIGRPAPEMLRAVLSFDDVYDEHFSFVWRSLRRLGVAERGLDDAAQEVFLTVHRRLRDFEGRSSVRTWLFGIAVNVARHARRSEHRRRTDELPESLPDPGGSTPHDDASKAEAVKILHELLDQLDDEKRTCFVLIELEQLSAPDVAASLGLSVNTVYSRLRSARREFEQALARHRARDQRRYR